MGKIKTFLRKLSYKTGVVICLMCIPCYIISFAVPILISISNNDSNVYKHWSNWRDWIDWSDWRVFTIWFIFFGLAKTFQYSGLTIIGGKGLFNFFRKKKTK